MKKFLAVILVLVMCVGLTVPAFAASIETGRSLPHIVSPGENLSKLALMYYGDSSKWRKIYEANKDVVKDPNLIFVGQRFTIPEVNVACVTPMENTKAYSVAATGENEGAEAAALTLASMYLDDMKKAAPGRTFTISKYKDLSVMVTPTLELSEVERYGYHMSNAEIGENFWLVEVQVAYQYTGFISPAGPSTGEWMTILRQGSPVGFLLTLKDGEYTFRSRLVEDGVSYQMGTNDPRGSVVISGYNAGYLEYNPTGCWMYVANPYFLDHFFVEVTTEGTARLEGDQLTFSFTRHDDPNSGAVSGAKLTFEVDLNTKTAAVTESVPYEGSSIELPEETMVSIGRRLAEVMRGAEEYRQQMEAAAGES